MKKERRDERKKKKKRKEDEDATAGGEERKKKKRRRKEGTHLCLKKEDVAAGSQSVVRSKCRLRGSRLRVSTERKSTYLVESNYKVHRMSTISTKVIQMKGPNLSN
ncbi:hypothetical protein CsSME_00028318 [Camellia sinensis var. sinensis]